MNKELKELFKKLDRDWKEIDRYERKRPEGMTLLEYMEFVDKPYLTDYWLDQTLIYWQDALHEAVNTGNRRRESIATERIQYYTDEKKKRI